MHLCLPSLSHLPSLVPEGIGGHFPSYPIILLAFHLLSVRTPSDHYLAQGQRSMHSVTWANGPTRAPGPMLPWPRWRLSPPVSFPVLYPQPTPSSPDRLAVSISMSQSTKRVFLNPNNLDSKVAKRCRRAFQSTKKIHAKDRDCIVKNNSLKSFHLNQGPTYSRCLVSFLFTLTTRCFRETLLILF